MSFKSGNGAGVFGEGCMESVGYDVAIWLAGSLLKEAFVWLFV